MRRRRFRRQRVCASARPALPRHVVRRRSMVKRGCAAIPTSAQGFTKVPGRARLTRCPLLALDHSVTSFNSGRSLGKKDRWLNRRSPLCREFSRVARAVQVYRRRPSSGRWHTPEAVRTWSDQPPRERTWRGRMSSESPRSACVPLPPCLPLPKAHIRRQRSHFLELSSIQTNR